MNKEEIVDQIQIKYDEFIEYLNELSQDDFDYSFEGKWSAGKQLEHIVICVEPLVQVYGLPKSFIEQNFGIIKRTNRSYQELKNEYLQKLNEGGKAPSQFVPEKESIVDKASLIESLKTMIGNLNSKINEFEEVELESLLIPHPLLRKITLKEMLYNAIYHVEHHQKQTIKNLENK